MFGFKGVHHIAMSVPSLAAAKSFYVDKLGFSIADQAHLPPSVEGDKVTALNGADCQVLMVKAGNLFLEIFEFHRPEPKPQNERRVCDHGYTHLAFEVEDINEAYHYLEDAGVRWHHTPVKAGKGYVMTYGRDPFGNVIEIQQLVDGLPYSYNQLLGGHP
ncbi:VOC family protein [Luminiphilus sp. nBUS_16]|uniref:VOC family protein n=1 Tax=Luminiphilus sp. nBUS_16 TaxID=3395315 RepID=UPI003EB7321A